MEHSNNTSLFDRENTASIERLIELLYKEILDCNKKTQALQQEITGLSGLKHELKDVLTELSTSITKAMIYLTNQVTCFFDKALEKLEGLHYLDDFITIGVPDSHKTR